jgi:hypothetical protein
MARAPPAESEADAAKPFVRYFDFPTEARYFRSSIGKCIELLYKLLSGPES